MRKLRVKALAVGCVLVVSAMLLALTPPSVEPDPPLGTSKYQTEKADLREDLAGIQFHRAELVALKDKKRADKQAGKDMAVIVDRKLISKAKADLQRDKKYLRADKKDLRQDYRLAIREQKDDHRVARKEVAAAKSDLRCALRKDDAAGIQSASASVVRLLGAESAEAAELESLRGDRHEDLLAVNREVKKAQGQFAGTLAVESAYLHASEWVMR